MEATDRRGHSQLCAEVPERLSVLRHKHAQQSAEGAALRVEAELAVHLRQESHYAAGLGQVGRRRDGGRSASVVRAAARPVRAAVHRQVEGGGAGVGEGLRGAGVCAQRFRRHRDGGAAGGPDGGVLTRHRAASAVAGHADEAAQGHHPSVQGAPGVRGGQGADAGAGPVSVVFVVVVARTLDKQNL